MIACQAGTETLQRIFPFRVPGVFAAYFAQKYKNENCCTSP